MKKNMLIFIIFIIMLVNIITFLMIFNFWDPFKWTDEIQNLAKIAILTTITLWWSCFIGLVIYYLKKIWYKNEIYIKNIFSSLRQWFFLTIFSLALIYFNSIWMLEIKTISISIFIIILLELTFKNLES